jgi:predicted RNase H-like nuclease (RuvC/YqgF family)
MFSKKRAEDKKYIEEQDKASTNLDLEIAKLRLQVEEKMKKIDELERQLASQNTSKPSMS